MCSNIRCDIFEGNIFETKHGLRLFLYFRNIRKGEHIELQSLIK